MTPEIAFNDSPLKIIFVFCSPFDVILENLIKVVAPLLKLGRNVFHVCYYSHPTLMLQVLFMYELITKLQLFFAQIVEGLRQLSPYDNGLVFGT